jgi:hypothetical protein
MSLKQAKSASSYLFKFKGGVLGYDQSGSIGFVQSSKYKGKLIPFEKGRLGCAKAANIQQVKIKLINSFFINTPIKIFTTSHQ